jgi:hypothetical protein
LASRLGDLAEREKWPDLFGDNPDWLPWILEVKFEHPIGDYQRTVEQVKDLRESGDWTLVAWDEQLVAEARRKRLLLWVLATPALLVFAIVGAPITECAAGGPSVTGLRPYLFIGMISGAWMLAAGTIMALVGFSPDLRSWVLGPTLAFVLAGLVAPMLERAFRFAFKPESSIDPACNGGNEGQGSRTEEDL